MEYELIPSKFFLEQLDQLTSDAKKIIKEKLRLVKSNPYRFKRIVGFNLFLCRIRFEDNRKEKRVVYLVDKPQVKLLCILDRGSEYKHLRKFLKQHGYL